MKRVKARTSLIERHWTIPFTFISNLYGLKILF